MAGMDVKAFQQSFANGLDLKQIDGTSLSSEQKNALRKIAGEGDHISADKMGIVFTYLVDRFDDNAMDGKASFDHDKTKARSTLDALNLLKKPTPGVGVSTRTSRTSTR